MEWAFFMPYIKIFGCLYVGFTILIVCISVSSVYDNRFFLLSLTLNANSMENLTVFNYNGNEIAFKEGDNMMINATQMAKPFNKRPNDYLSLSSTNELINAITRKNGNCDNQVVTTLPGSPENGGGTWMNRILALDFAQWLSVDLKLWCTERIDELMRYGMTATKPTIDAMIDNPDLLIKLATQLKEERTNAERLRVIAELQEKEIKEAAPKVEYFEKAMSSKSSYTTTQMAQEFGLSAKTLNARLAKMGVQYRQGGAWILYAKYQGNGYTHTVSVPYMMANGEQGTQIQTRWTEKGRKFLHDLMDGK